MWDNENIGEYLASEQERWERTHHREEIEENKEDLEDERFTDSCKPTTGHHHNQF